MPTPLPVVSTGYPIADAVLAILGALYVVLSLAATLFPKGSATGAVLAKVAGDIKGHLAPAGKPVELEPGANVVQITPPAKPPEPPEAA